MEAPQKTKFRITIWSSNPTSGHISGQNYNLKRYKHPYVHSSSKQPKCPSTDEWIKKMWCIYEVEYYSAIKKNGVLLFVATWMNLESIMLSETSQRKKQILYDITYMWNLKNKTNQRL